MSRGGGPVPPVFAPVDDPDAVPIRDAATVALVRDAPAGTDSVTGREMAPGIEVFLIQRVQEMAFAGGMTVFPGGGVDPRDAEADIGWAGPEPSWWASQFGASATGGADTDAAAQSLVCAAVRETFEECGVLLAGHTADDVVIDTAPYDPARTELVDKTVSFAGFLRRHDLVLRADLLAPLAHWITPRGERRRYDTRFFLAALPPGQSADDRTTEAASAGWRRVAHIMDDWRAGHAFLLPPTWAQLDEIARYDTVADLMGAHRTIEAITPTIVSDGSAVRIEFEGSDRYTGR